MEKIIGAALIIIGLGSAAYLYLGGTKKMTAVKNQAEIIRTFSDLVSADIRQMLQKKEMPEAALQIQSVVYNFHSELGRQLINNQKIKLSEQPNGAYRLELDFIEVPDEKVPQMIIQYSLFVLNTNNKIWELGKTYSLEKFVHQKETVPTEQGARH